MRKPKAMKTTPLTRRQVLRRGAALLGSGLVLPSFIPATALGQTGTAPSDRIQLGIIGVGPRGTDVLSYFLLENDVRFIAACDAQQARRQAGKKMIDDKYGNADCKMYADIFEATSRPEIDAFLIATGDRMHSHASMLAARAGKDMYSEKPMSLTIEEGRALVSTTQRFGTVYQCGHQRRSVDSYQFVVEVCRRGLIGKVHTAIARVWQSNPVPPDAPQTPPEGFDWDRWLGPTPWHPYSPARVGNWNDFWDTGGGVLIAMGCHYTDIVQWAFDKDDTGPIHYEGTAEWAANSFTDVPITCEVNCDYADGKKLLIQSQGAFADRFLRFIGDEGWIQIDDETNIITAEPASLLRLRGISSRGWSHPGGHIRNFVDAIRSRRQTTCPPEISHRATTVCHAANIALRLGRAVSWDPKLERFVNDPEADRMIGRALRPPWKL
jgi:predicted dehydrogenase